jgi:hypothetical protein
MEDDRTDFTVVSVRRADAPPGDTGESEAPPELLERFEGRTFTLNELEQRGVRIAGGKAYCTANGADWRLELWPHPGAA